MPRPQKIDKLLDLVRECIRLGRYRDTRHAKDRQEERHISLPDILHILNTGHHEKSKDQFDEAFNAWNYAIRGITLADGKDLRVIVSFDQERSLLIITTFYLEKR